MRANGRQRDAWNTLNRGNEQEVMTVALEQLAESLRLHQKLKAMVIFAALGWGTALPLAVWYFAGGSCQ